MGLLQPITLLVSLRMLLYHWKAILVNTMIVSDLQECIGPDSKNESKSLQATKKSSKKTSKVSLKGVKNSNKSSIVTAPSNPNSEQQVTHVSNGGAVSSSISTATTIPASECA